MVEISFEFKCVIMPQITQDVGENKENKTFIPEVS